MKDISRKKLEISIINGTWAISGFHLEILMGLNQKKVLKLIKKNKSFFSEGDILRKQIGGDLYFSKIGLWKILLLKNASKREMSILK